MLYFHKLEAIDIDLTAAVLGHSADETVVYKDVNGSPICLGYYFPKDFDRTMKYPAFILIHGGGWESHKIFADQSHWQGDYLGFLARYYADKGMVCVSVDYRLASECGQAAGYEIIDCYEDCCDAVDYVLAHADRYGVDTGKLYLLGESAGGHLAGAVATFHYDRRYRFGKVFLVNPITHLEDRWKAYVPRESAHPRLKGLTLEERSRFLSPLYQLSEDMSDTVLIHGESDAVVAPEHSKRFYERMKGLSKSCELHVIENTDHAFLLAEYYNGLAACDIALNIIDSAF